MKKALFALFAAVVLGLGFVSCNPADLDDVNGRIDELETRVAALEKLNTDITDLRALITALQNNISVVSVTSVTDGYEILLSNNEKITIKNGKNGENGENGENGKDGSTPVIGVKADGGVYYWTVNGEFLLDGNGSKVRVTSAAPKLKIEENKWYISYDEGATWEFVASAGVPGGDSIFSSVTVGEDCVTFVLADGATFMIPLATEFAIVMDQALEIAPGATASVAYAITGAAEPVVYCIAEGGYSAKISAKTATTGDVVITAPAEKAEGVVIVFAESEGQSIFKSIKLAPAAEKAPVVLVDPVVDLCAVAFDHTKAIDAVAVTLNWTSECTSPAYTLEISTSSEMADPIIKNLDAATTISLTNRDLNQLVCGEFDGEFKTTDLYYRINEANGSALPSETKTFSFSTEFGSFTDPRDGEVYPVTKVGDKYWMTENLRALKYSDGASFEEIAGFVTVQYDEGALGKRAGIYYSWGHALRGWYEGHWFDPMLGTDAQEQGVCPDGWHIASANDFDYACSKAAEALGTTCSGSIFDESYSPAIAQAFRFAGDFSTLAEGCTYTNDLGLYFVPAGHFAENTAAAGSEPYQYGWETLVWTSAMFDGWNARVFQTNQWSNTIFAYHYGLNSNGWSASMPVRCVKNY